ncbi:hypothetical protein ABTN14_18845, partial [Acinetobacter baumannii]
MIAGACRRVLTNCSNITTLSAQIKTAGCRDGLCDPVITATRVPESSQGEADVNKIYPDATSALAGLIEDGQTLAVGGFGL